MKISALSYLTGLTLTLFSAQAVHAAGVTSTIVSNTCNSDSSIRLAEYSPTHYNAYSSTPFNLVNKSCEIKLRVKVPAGSKLRLKNLFSRGKVTLFGSTASGHYGMSVRTSDDKNYVGGSQAFNATKSWSQTDNFSRGTGSTCGGTVDVIIRHDGGATQPANTQMKVEYNTFYIDQVSC